MIEVGDTITNDRGQQACIDEVNKGEHGILAYGKFIDNNELYGAYFPYELPPSTSETIFGERPERWNWGYTILPSRARIGSVAWECVGPRTKESIAMTVDELDKRWARTSLPVQAQSGVITLEELISRKNTFPR